MKKISVNLSNGEKIPTIITDQELIYGVTGIAVGRKNNYLKIEDNISAIHPLTKERLPIVILDNKALLNTAMMLVPAHIQEHFDIAEKYNLEFKQVVAPYFKGKDDEALNPNVETQYRTSVIAVIKNKDNSYLCVDAKKRLCKSFVLGGIENGETPEEAAIREIKEETGYTDVQINRRSIFVLHNHFYAKYKGVNRYAYLYTVFGNLNSEKRVELSKEEAEKQRTVWVKRSELKNFLTVNNNIFVNNTILDKDCAYEGDGIMINSDKLNKKLRSEVANENYTYNW